MSGGGAKVFKRVVHFANLPIQMLMPTSFSNITEISLKTIPSASKIEIKRVLESLYGFEVDKVNTLNREGKHRRGRGYILKRADYKKAYVTLKYPLSISPDLYPIQLIEDAKREQAKNAKSNTGKVEDEASEAWKQSHWLDEKREDKVERRGKGSRGSRGGGRERLPPKEAITKFPWSYLQGGGKAPSGGGGEKSPLAGGEKSPRRGERAPRGGEKEPTVANTKFPWSSLKTLKPR